MDDTDEAKEAKPSVDLTNVHARARRRFDESAMPQMEIRALALQARRFVTVPGAQWEGDWGDQFENSIKVEVDKIHRGLRKIQTDYRENRIVPDFRPAGYGSDQTTADTLDGLHRADSYEYKSQQARDNAFSEGAAGGFGAYRLKAEWADPLNKDSDEQRINPGLAIVDADQRVFFDANSVLYDKSDARFCFVITALTRDAFEEEWEGYASNWPENNLYRTAYEWFKPDTIRICEYYEVEMHRERLLVWSYKLTGETERIWASEMDTDEIAEKKALGWTLAEQRRDRRRIHKYTMSGSEILKDNGFIAGARIPIAPFYGNRDYVDGIERFTGYVQKKMDSQRLYNAKVSKLAETDALAPFEKPIFTPEQMPPHLATLWANSTIERHGFHLANPLIDPVSGSIISVGPIGNITPPQLPPVTSALLQIANNDLTEDDQDGSDEAKANTSVDAMELAAARVDAKSAIFLDNFRQTVQCEGEIYLSMAAEIYYEPGRTVETMDEDGGDGEAELQKPMTDATGNHFISNDFTKGKYKVIADVTEATATRRDKTVRSSLNTASVAMHAGDQTLARAAVITAIMNQDGEGMTDLQKFARKSGVEMGMIEPNEEEQAQMEQASQRPDPNAELVTAQAKALLASAGKDMALAGKAEADTALSQAKVGETKAKTIETLHGAHVAANDHEEKRRFPFARDAA